jgi:hypothetical protein
MTPAKTLACIAGSVVAVGVVIGIHAYRNSTRPIVLTGAVVREDPDPRNQVPVPNVNIAVVDGPADETAKSDASGLFRLTVHPGLLRDRPVTLRFQHTEYKPSEITAANKDDIYVVRLAPRAQTPAARPDHNQKPIQIKNVRVRYSLKNQTTAEVGSVAKQFEVKNTGNQPCKGRHPCSPDGKWKASVGTLNLDAQKGNEFRNVRVSCIAGPCPFTRVQSADLAAPSRKIEINALNWSDTASFLVEAEVTRTMTADTVRQAYPFMIGDTMTFALPAESQGPSIVADLNGEQIVFPLGPALLLTWATCSVEVAPANKIYRCELKPGYQFPD